MVPVCIDALKFITFGHHFDEGEPVSSADAMGYKAGRVREKESLRHESPGIHPFPLRQVAWMTSQSRKRVGDEILNASSWLHHRHA